MKNRYGLHLIHEETDDFGCIEVAENNNYRSLHFGNGCKQSEIWKSSPHLLTLQYMQHMMTSLLFNLSPKNILILGMGAGNIPHFLYYYFQEAKIDICDIRRRIFFVARSFFYFPQSPRIRCYVGDAFQYLRFNKNQNYEMIFVDIYQKTGVSESVRREGFFFYLEKNLTENGMLIFNLWHSAEEEIIELKAFVQNLPQKKLLQLPVGHGNIIFLVVPEALLLNPIMLPEKFIQVFARPMAIPFRSIFQKLEIENNLNLFSSKKKFFFFST